MRILLVIALSLAFVATTPNGIQAQEQSLSLRNDSLARRMLLSRHPCPRPIPTGWVAGDTANGTGIKCSLIVAAMRGAENAMIQYKRPKWDPRRVPCVTVAPAEPLPNLGPLWRVTFYRDSTRATEVTVDLLGNTIVGREVSPQAAMLTKPCPAV